MRQFLTLLRSSQYFTTRDWKIENSNVKELMSELTSADKKVIIISYISDHHASYVIIDVEENYIFSLIDTFRIKEYGELSEPRRYTTCINRTVLFGCHV